jgi:hypothetical protein
MQHSRSTITHRLVLLLGLLAILAGCGPEDGRARGGPGADVGNHPVNVKPRSKVFVGESQP